MRAHPLAPRQTPPTPRIIFTAEAYIHMLKGLQAKATNHKEIAWLGQVERLSANTFRVHTIHYPPQTANTGTWVETDDAFGEWIGKTFTTLPARKSIRLHGHSHPKMAVNPSGTDVQLFKELKEQNSDYFIRVIINEDNNINCDMFNYDVGFEYYKLPVEIEIIENHMYVITDGDGKYKIALEEGQNFSGYSKHFSKEDSYVTISHPNNAFAIIKDVLGDDIIVIAEHFIIKNGTLALKENKELEETIEKDLKDKIKPKTVVKSAYGYWANGTWHSYASQKKEKDEKEVDKIFDDMQAEEEFVAMCQSNCYVYGKMSGRYYYVDPVSKERIYMDELE